jgi:hypothetical protein
LQNQQLRNSTKQNILATAAALDPSWTQDPYPIIAHLSTTLRLLPPPRCLPSLSALRSSGAAPLDRARRRAATTCIGTPWSSSIVSCAPRRSCSRNPAKPRALALRTNSLVGFRPPPVDLGTSAHR